MKIKFWFFFRWTRRWYLLVIVLLYIGLLASFSLNVSLLLRKQQQQQGHGQQRATVAAPGSGVLVDSGSGKKNRNAPFFPT